MLIKFLTSTYRSLVGIAAWVVLVVGLASGIVLGVLLNNALLGGEYAIIPVVTGLVGILSAFVAEVVIIPPFMILFNIEARVKFIEGKLKENK